MSVTPVLYLVLSAMTRKSPIQVYIPCQEVIIGSLDLALQAIGWVKEVRT